jgi:glc operon protein GlcG
MDASSGSFAPSFVLTNVGVSKAMAAAENEAMTNGWNVTIVICDAGGIPLQVHRNAFAASVDIAIGKARSAALFGKETSALEQASNVESGSGRTALLSSPFVLMRGGVPIIIEGNVSFGLIDARAHAGVVVVNIYCLHR